MTIDKSGANLAALESINSGREAPVTIRQTKYLNNIIEQDHRAIKRRTRPMLGFKNFRCACIILSGIEVMHMIRKGQMQGDSRWSNAAIDLRERFARRIMTATNANAVAKYTLP